MSMARIPEERSQADTDDVAVAPCVVDFYDAFLSSADHARSVNEAGGFAVEAFGSARRSPARSRANKHVVLGDAFARLLLPGHLRMKDVHLRVLYPL